MKITRSYAFNGDIEGDCLECVCHSAVLTQVNPPTSKKIIPVTLTAKSDGITMGASSAYDRRLMMSMGTQKCGASSSTKLQPQLMSSSLGLTPVLGTAGDLSDMFAGLMAGLEELRHDMTMDRVE